MVIDAAKGIEARTRKLFEVCRLRDIPIITFINKMDRESRDPFDLLDEIEKTLALDTAPVTWPIGRGRDFAGTYDIASGEMRLLSEDGKTGRRAQPLDLAALAAQNPMLDAKADRRGAGAGQGRLPPFDSTAFREGHLTPVFFGSALRNFGVEDLLDALAGFAPPPRAQSGRQAHASRRTSRGMTASCSRSRPTWIPTTATASPSRGCARASCTRGMKAKLVRTGKPITLSAPQFFFAQDRALADEAYAGDVVGIPNHGTLRIGDTLTEGEDIVFLGVPNFAPEILRRVKLGDAMKAKKLKEALQQMAEEGVVQVFRPHDGAPALVGVVGPLQLDVLKVRLDDEYGLDIGFETPEFQLARWISARRRARSSTISCRPIIRAVAEDLDGDRVFMARNQFILDYTARARAGHCVQRHQGREEGGLGR